jgi:hypothetical protein
VVGPLRDFVSLVTDRANRLSIERELLGPVLALPRAAATEITTLFAEEVLGLVAPRRIPLATFIEDLLEPARITSGREPEAEEPEVDEELADPQRYDDAALAAAARIFEARGVADLKPARPTPVGRATNTCSI